MTMLRSISTVLTLLATSGCALVAGTSDYEPCGEGEGGCGEGGDGSGASTSTSTSSTTSTSSAGGCFIVKVEVRGSVKAEIDNDDALDISDGQTDEFCLAPGPHTIVASCDQGGGSDPPAIVSWGNDFCTSETSSCAFTLTEPESFVLDPVDCD